MLVKPTQARNVIAAMWSAKTSRTDAQFFSDGSTDSAVIIIMKLYMLALQVVFVKFLGLLSVPKADAQHITSAITATTSTTLGIEMEEWKQRLVSNGAAVMLGRSSGVVKQLSEGFPHVLGIHCKPPRLELSFKGCW